MGEVSPAFGCRHRGIVAAVGCVAASGWDTLGYLILLLLCIGPALGCIIGIVADWLWRKRDYAVSARSYVFMAALPLLVVAAAIFTDWHGNLGARSMYDIPSKESVFPPLKKEPIQLITTTLSAMTVVSCAKSGANLTVCSPAFGEIAGRLMTAQM